MILTNEQIKQIIVGYFKDKPVNKVWLFGSYARGEANENSDIDILVNIDPNSKTGLHYLCWHEDIEALVNKNVQIVSERAMNKNIRPFIDADKLLVYER